MFRSRLVLEIAAMSVVAMGLSSCVIYSDRVDSSPAAGGSAPLLEPAFDGGEHPASWREDKDPIVDDKPRWFVPPVADRYRYPADRVQSPIPKQIAKHLRNVALHGARLKDNVFMKVGDGITDSEYYLRCFRGDINNLASPSDFNIVLGSRRELSEAIFHFRSADLDGNSPFDRESLAAQPGQSVGWVIAPNEAVDGGGPSPLLEEFEAIKPQFAGIMFGTSDVESDTPADLEGKLRLYARGMRELVDTVLSLGVVPWLSTIPPRADQAALSQVVPIFNAIVRALAEGRQVPLLDYNLALQGVKDFGLESDGVNPSNESYNTACFFNSDSLEYGYNVRNLSTLRTLDRLMKVVVDGRSELDDDAPRIDGDGSLGLPFLVDVLPFTDMRDIHDSVTSSAREYPDCDGAEAPGPEYVYEYTTDIARRVRALVFDFSGGGPLNLDVFVQDAASGKCIAKGDLFTAVNLSPGTYLISVDTVADDESAPAEYAFAVVECARGDSRCN